MSQHIRSEKIKRGDKVLIAAFGAGLTSGAAVFEF
jgi:3-oxoacyl-[acyl-carrier-protein] synthase III